MQTGNMLLERGFSPISILESLFQEQDWPFRRTAEQGLYLETSGSWVNYRLYFKHQTEQNYLHVSASYDLRVPEARRPLLAGLLMEINHHVTIGHFDLLSEDGAPTWRFALPLRGVNQLSRLQLEDILDQGLCELERFYPAFQGLLWGGLSPQLAVKSSLMECTGMA